MESDYLRIYSYLFPSDHFHLLPVGSVGHARRHVPLARPIWEQRLDSRRGQCHAALIRAVFGPGSRGHGAAWAEAVNAVHVDGGLFFVRAVASASTTATALFGGLGNRGKCFRALEK